MPELAERICFIYGLFVIVEGDIVEEMVVYSVERR